MTPGQSPRDSLRTASAAGLAFVAVLLVAYGIYSPGLSGAFLFDDWSNLVLLGHQGRIDSFDKVVSFLLTGFAGPTGRPVSMASFLLDAQTWPAEPAPFKLTNILIHLLNGALLTGALWRLAQRLDAPRREAAWIAVLGAGLWLLHPLWVSTTLYVVQRMTMLAATFVFAGLWAYLHGRQLLGEGRGAAGYGWCSAAVVLCGPLAVLSKENGALLPLLILVVDRYAPAPVASLPRGWSLWRLLFLGVPSVLLLAYLAMGLPGLVRGDAGFREFTPGQRLLTQARIIWEYLALLLLPRPYSDGLFSDAIPVSKGLLSPPSTLVGLLALAGLVALAERLRRSVPVVAVAIMFFLAGHVLESTWIQLELRFEHRNYLPAALLFLPLAWWLVRTPVLGRKGRAVAAAALCCVLAAETWIAADLWGRPFAQALAWARRNPDSPRAQSHLANMWTQVGNHAEAERVLRRVWAKHPADMLLLAGLVGAECKLGALSPGSREALFAAVEAADPSYPVTRFQVDKTLSFLRAGGCRDLGRGEFDQLIDAGLANPRGSEVAPWRQMLLQQRAQLRLDQGRGEDAFDDLMEAARAVPSDDGVLAGAALLAQRGEPALALRFLDTAARPDEAAPPAGPLVARLRVAWKRHTQYHVRESRELRKTIEQELRLLKSG